MITVSIKEDNTEISRRILKEIVNYLNVNLHKCVDIIESQTKIYLEDAIKGQREYTEVIYGELRYELGVVNALTKMQAIVDAIVNSVSVKVKKLSVSGVSIKGGLVIEGVRSGYQDLISMPEASYLTKKGVKIEWLDWLLTEGSNTIITDYHFQLLPGRGRTGGGLMLRGGDWSVPSQFAGTVTDNFILRAIKEIEPKIEAVTEICLGLL